MKSGMKQTLGSTMAIGQGLLTAVAPQLSTKLITRMIQKNFNNAEDIEAKPSYLRQLRAFGIGLAAAGIAGLAMELVSDDGDESEQ